MYDALLRGCERHAVGIENKAALPSRGRLLMLLKKYASPGASAVLDESSFGKFISNEHRSIPSKYHRELYKYVSKGRSEVSINTVIDTLLPERFTKETSVLDLPCTYHDAKKSKESVADGAEAIRLEMINFLSARGLSLRDYFEKIDSDSNNAIDTRELVASLRHDGLGIGRYNACRFLIHRFESTNRGLLSFPDFERLMHSTSPKAQNRITRMAKAMLSRLGDFDRSSGKVSRFPNATKKKRPLRSKSAVRRSANVAKLPSSVRKKGRNATSAVRRRPIQRELITKNKRNETIILRLSDRKNQWFTSSRPPFLANAPRRPRWLE